MVEAIGVGKTLDLATDDALLKLCAKREEAEIEPLEAGSKGFLGLGSKPARVRATLRDDDRIRTSVFLRNILAFMEIETAMDVKEDDDEIVVSLGEEASPLIGHHGQTLDALQYLVSRFLNGEKEDWRKVVLDIDHYRGKREDNLRSMAEKYADKVIQSKRDYKTQPLSATERRIIHMSLKENKDVVTFSIGNGEKKRVVIALNDKSGAPSRRRSPRRSSGGRSDGPRGGDGSRGGKPRGGSRGGGSRRNDSRGGRSRSQASS